MVFEQEGRFFFSPQVQVFPLLDYISIFKVGQILNGHGKAAGVHVARASF